jgi:hypothetical protein
MSRLAGIKMLQREIDTAIRAGLSIEQIDSQIIAPCLLSAHARCALWVYAHSRVSARPAGLPRRAEA